MRDYSKPLTIVLTGMGTSTKTNTKALLEDFIFGNLPEDAKVDIKLVVPFDHKIGNNLFMAIEQLKLWGIDGSDFIPIVEPDCGHKTVASAKSTVQVDQGDALQAAIDILHEDYDAGRNVAFISIYNPDSTQDLFAIEHAKNNDWLTTLNLAEGLIDSFSGYESTDDRIKREEAVAEFERQVLANAPVEETPAPKKRAAKKTTTPRKKPVEKVLEPEDVPLVEEPETAPTASAKPKPAAGLVADAVRREEEKKAARANPETLGMVKGTPPNYATDHKDMPTLSGTIVIGKSTLPRELEPVRKEGDSWEEIVDGNVYGYQMLNGKIQSTGNMGPLSELSHVPASMVDHTSDVWKDVAKAVPAMPDSVTVSKSDIVQLGDAMQKMAEGFSDAIAVYKKIVENS